MTPEKRRLYLDVAAKLKSAPKCSHLVWQYQTAHTVQPGGGSARLCYQVLSQHATALVLTEHDFRSLLI